MTYWWARILVTCNSLPNNKILDCSKLKAFADDNIRVLKIIIFVFERVENNVGKGENAGHQHFLLFPRDFQITFYSGSLKVGIVWCRVKAAKILIHIHGLTFKSNTIVSACTMYRHLQQYCSHTSMWLFGRKTVFVLIVFRSRMVAFEMLELSITQS